ncbi:MAG: hypothetical protein LBK61_08175 [Spirochaetaceae bacterium]|jgi:hypothetical protein|nr:hypothetical protein [Spirochaetaceae bacterium]
MINHIKKIFLFLLVAGISFNLFAQEENPPDVSRFSWGTALDYLPEGSGSGACFEFGFLIFHNDKAQWDIRNHVSFGGVRMHDDDGARNIMFYLNEKISSGGITRNGLFRSYGFIEGGVGFYESETKKMSEMPLAYRFGFGFGLDIFIRDDTSFFIESGVNYHIMDAQWLSMPRMTVGLRCHF